jgi:hypothetical protein
VAKIEKFGEIKRPSVETEGRLTIACHMKNLQKICVAGDHNSLTFPSLLVVTNLSPTSPTKTKQVIPKG